MNFGLNDTQQTIKNTAREFLAKECPIAEVRRLMETDSAFDVRLWARIAEQGWTGMLVPEQYDGFGLSLVELAAVMEEMGRALLPGPFVSTVLLAGSVLEQAGTEAQKQRYLRAICRGEARSTLALVEKRGSWDPDDVLMKAAKQGDGYRLDGEKLFVGDAGVADFMLVAARLDGELAILIVPGDAPGLTKDLMPAVDLTRKLYRVRFSGVAVPADHLVARGQEARRALDVALDVACVGLAAESVGGMQQLVDLTVAYAKTRSQFGKPIGTFQAVQHQCVDMLVLLEGTRSAAYYAAWTLSQGEPDASVAAAVAKSYAGEAFRDVGNRSIQVQGGMGFTWENDAHLYYRRAKGSEIAFGDGNYHRDRIGRILLGSTKDTKDTKGTKGTKDTKGTKNVASV
jgi:alkylation response protein AidB-like acyl-CoA dehydrogenase